MACACVFVCVGGGVHSLHFFFSNMKKKKSLNNLFRIKKFVVPNNFK